MENTLNLNPGDYVWDSKYGDGIVAEYNEAKAFCYDVKFDNPQHPNLRYVSYDREGKDNSIYRTLFKECKRNYYSPRGEQLVFVGKPFEKPIVTIENYTKWYNIFLVMPDGEVKVLEDSIEMEFIDHTPFPGSVYRYIQKLDYYFDEQSYELMVGRILDEHPEYTAGAYTELIYANDSDNLYSYRS